MSIEREALETMIQQKFARLKGNPSLDPETSGWNILQVSIDNEEDYSSSGQMRLDIYRYGEVWLNQHAVLVKVIRESTLAIASMMTDWKVSPPHPLSAQEIEDLTYLDYRDRRSFLLGEAAVLGKLRDLPDQAQATSMDPSIGSTTTRPRGFLKRMFG